GAESSIEFYGTQFPLAKKEKQWQRQRDADEQCAKQVNPQMLHAATASLRKDEQPKGNGRNHDIHAKEG
ncbi:MAG TPA: hypothetical protein VFH31_00780, partial [Pyrinomonadaceae bacterium]|nr:hypothetical protein [Pyrinomonadaceae bacterium]